MNKVAADKSRAACNQNIMKFAFVLHGNALRFVSFCHNSEYGRIVQLKREWVWSVICVCGGIKRVVVRGNCVKSLRLCFYSPLRSIITAPFPNSISQSFAPPQNLKQTATALSHSNSVFTVCQPLPIKFYGRKLTAVRRAGLSSFRT